MLPVIDTPTTSTAEAVTLVASHSFGFSSREWIEVAGLLSDSYRTVAVDAPGFGRAADIGGYSMEEMPPRSRRPSTSCTSPATSSSGIP